MRWRCLRGQTGSRRFASTWICRRLESSPETPALPVNPVENQQRTFLRLLGELRPHWRRDRALAARIQAQLARHRQFGSRDRRLYRELLYTTLRFLPWIEPLLGSRPEEAVRRVAWLAAETPATAAFRAALATGEPPAGEKAELLPAWFRAHCPAIFSGPELDAQLRRAPLWLRLQTAEPDRVLAEFDRRGWSWRRSAILPDAVALVTEADVTTCEAWNGGRFEVQDLGSQLVLEAAGIAPGGHWLDACAGAGGKTLQLARLLGSGGRVDASDPRAEALEELGRRAHRARADCRTEGPEQRRLPEKSAAARRSAGDVSFASISVLPTPPTAVYDGVLVDAPCSGSGTWRRSPHLKWTTTEAHVGQAADKQLALLDAMSARVAVGGRLVYATCSLSSRENEDVVAVFLRRHPEFQAGAFARDFGLAPRGPGRLILPAQYDTDGFFVAALRKT